MILSIILCNEISMETLNNRVWEASRLVNTLIGMEPRESVGGSVPLSSTRFALCISSIWLFLNSWLKWGQSVLFALTLGMSMKIELSCIPNWCQRIGELVSARKHHTSVVRKKQCNISHSPIKTMHLGVWCLGGSVG